MLEFPEGYVLKSTDRFWLWVKLEGELPYRIRDLTADDLIEERRKVIEGSEGTIDVQWGWDKTVDDNDKGE